MFRRNTVYISVLWLYLLMAPLLCENLLCYYSPIQHQETQGMFKLVVTECPPKELCYKAHGSYGNHSALTARGCMLLKDCNKVNRIRLRGAFYNTSYTCCDWDYCNSSTSHTASLFTLLIVVILGVI